MTHFLTEFRKIILPSQVPHDLWPWKGPYPSYCNGYMYALKPEVGMKLAAVSRFTPLLPLDDIFITGVLRGRLNQPRVGIKLLNRFGMYGHDFIQWILQCPFMGVIHHHLVQNLAYQRDHWPWGTFYKVVCNVLKRYFDHHLCG